MKVKILLKEVRTKRGISLRQLEEMSGVSRAHLNAIELQHKEPRISILIKVAKALEVSIEELYEVEW